MVLVAILLLALQGEPTQGVEGRRLVRFRAALVDGVDELVVRRREATVRHIQWSPIEGLEVEVDEPIPRSDELRVVVRARVGRPTVRVVQQPSAANDGELCVRIDDGPHGGAAPLSFELWAVPAMAGSSVVLVTIDSLRPDHLGCSGYTRATSPNIDAFASGAVRYANAFSTSSFTPPAHASLLTSRQVGDHGLMAWNALDDSQLSLAEVLAAQGYRTGASVNLALLSENNLGQGFDWRHEGQREARTIVTEGLEFIRAAGDEPFFLWLHLYDVHRPYGRIPGWTDRFSASPRPGIGDGEEHYNLTPDEVLAQGLTPEDLAWIEERYDAGIAYVDAQLGPLLAELSTQAHRARTLVILTADHGESLREHEERLFSHDPYLHSAVARVPLLIRYPDGLGGGLVRSDPVSLIDVAPTVLATLGLKAPPSFDGRSLRALEHNVRWPEREIYLECWGWERLAAVRSGRWLVIGDVARGSTRLFALDKDPAELDPLEPSTRRDAGALVKKLAAFVARLPEGVAPPELDPELQRKLRELGYVGD